MAKILITYASFGQGHKKGAQALSQYLGAEAIDLLDFSHSFLKKICVYIYQGVTQKQLWLWKLLFNLAKNRFIYRFLTGAQNLIFKSFLRYLEEVNPDIIISTHFFSSDLAALYKKRKSIKLICVVTDLRAHPIWANSKIDYYYTALEETKKDLIKWGVKSNKVQAGYIPIRSGFTEKPDRQELLKKFSLKDKPTITFVSSSRGDFKLLPGEIKSLLGNFNLFVVYGKNKKLKDFLETISDEGLRYYSFYERIWELFSLSVIIVGKPGGLTVFEGLYKKKFFVFTQYIPGQEEENMDLLVNFNLAKFAKTPQEFNAAVSYFTNLSSDPNHNYPIELKSLGEPIKNFIAKD